MSDALVAEANAVVDSAVDTIGSDLESDALNPFSDVEGEEGSDEDAELSGEESEEDEDLTPKEIEKEIKKLKKLSLKYNGKSYEEELPFDIPDTPEAIEYMTKQLQMSKMSQHKAQELSAIESDIRQFVEDLRNNPKAVLSDPKIGLDLKQLAAQIVEEELENAKKSPEQIEKEALERQLKEMVDERDREKEEFRTKEMERLQQQEFDRYDSLMSQALDGSDLPKTPYVVKKMADYMIMAINNGYDVEPKDILPIVRDEILADVRSMADVMEPDQLLKVFGDNSYEKVRKHRLSRGKKKAKSAATNKKAKDVGAAPKEKVAGEPESKLTYKDFFDV